jgi:hypothetical protein
MKSARVYTVGHKNTETRYLTLATFKRYFYNGDFARRQWLIYSPSEGKVYCSVCNYFLTLIPHITQAVLMAGSMHLRPFRIEKMYRNTGTA